MRDESPPQIPAIEELNPVTKAIRLIALEFHRAMTEYMGQITIDDEPCFICFQSDPHKIELCLRAMHNMAWKRIEGN